tara:strand:- start:1586 stop:2557 length:972 start_codon:yes stop_codon:yes gene_type:complete
MKKIYFRAVIASFCTSIAVISTSAFADLDRLTIGTNPSGSTFYLIGGGLSRLYQTELGIRSTAQPNAGSSVYLPMISTGDMTLGISNSIEASMAYNGEANFPIKMDNLRVLARIWSLPYAYLTTGDSGINTVEDLRGKRVMGNMSTNIALTRINKAILQSGGLTEEDVDFARSGGLMDGIEAVLQGRADAAPVATTMPVLMESHGTAPGGLRIIANGEQGTTEFFSNIVPGLSEYLAEPKSRHPYIVGETEITSYDIYVVANEDLSEEDAYRLTEVVYENWPQMQKDYPPLRAVPQEGLYVDQPTIPYHSGAESFFSKLEMNE